MPEQKVFPTRLREWLHYIRNSGFGLNSQSCFMAHPQITWSLERGLQF